MKNWLIYCGLKLGFFSGSDGYNFHGIWNGKPLVVSKATEGRICIIMILVTVFLLCIYEWKKKKK